MENNLLKTGYVMVSRALLMEMCEKQGKAMTDEEAFLRILTHVNYKNAETWCNGIRMTCARGESVISFVGWADILGWKRGHTRRFFERCIARGLVELVPDACPSHIRIPNYDAWTGKPAGEKKALPASGNSSEMAFEDSLLQFINRYSEVTRLPAESKDRLRGVWKKLSVRERENAIARIEDYYYSLANITYCYQAAKYLEYKIFENRA